MVKAKKNKYGQSIRIFNLHYTNSFPPIKEIHEKSMEKKKIFLIKVYVKSRPCIFIHNNWNFDKEMRNRKKRATLNVIF